MGKPAFLAWACALVVTAVSAFRAASFRLLTHCLKISEYLHKDSSAATATAARRSIVRKCRKGQRQKVGEDVSIVCKVNI